MSKKINLFEILYIILFILTMFSGSTFLSEYVMPFCCLIVVLLFFSSNSKSFYAFAKKNENGKKYKFVMVMIVLYLLIQLFYSFKIDTTLVFFERFFVYVFLICYVPKFNVILKLLKTIKIYSILVAISIIVMTLLTGIKSGGLVGNYQYSGMMMVISFGLFLNSFYSKKEKIDFFGILLSLLGLIISGKRMFALIAVFAYLIIFVFSQDKKKIIKMLFLSFVLFIAAICAYFFVPAVQNTIVRYISTSSDSTFNGRTYYWDVAKDIYSENKLFGIGMGCYRFYFHKYYHRYGNMESYDAHNIYYQMAAELGIIGETLFIILFIIGLFTNIRFLKKCKNNNYRYILIYTLFIQLWFTLYGLSGNTIYGAEQCFIYFCSVGMMYSVSCLEYKNEEV